jgi:glycosyltransferase involved in cell wall biosynthesis
MVAAASGLWPGTGMGRRSRRRNKPNAETTISFVAWGAVSGRSAEIADALGGEAYCLYPPGPGVRPPVLVRYVLSAVRTIDYLVRTRPGLVIVTNPPVFAGCVVLAWARRSGASVVLDSHPGGFGAQGDTVSARLQPLHRWLVRRVDLTMVTAPGFRQQVESWGGKGIIVHEAPGNWDVGPPPRLLRPKVLCVGRFAGDEPVEVVLQAAALTPECDFAVTGDLNACPPHLVETAPANVTFVGFLDPAGYRSAIQGATAVLTLTTEPLSVMRAAYEAVYAERPLIVSDWPINRELFADAVHVEHCPHSLSAGVRRLVAGYEGILARTGAARARQVVRWEAQREALLRSASVDRVEGTEP